MPKIFLVNNQYQADKKVYFVDNQYAADEKVFIVSNVYQADYKAFEVTNPYQADIKVFRVQNQYQADAFKASSRTPKSSGLFGSSSSSSSSEDTSSTSSSFSSSDLDEKRRNITRKQIEIDRMINDIEPTEPTKKPGCLVQILTWLILFAIVYGALNYFGFIGDDAQKSNDSNSGKIINTEGLNLRSSAGTDGEIIKLMIQNDSIWQINDSSQVIGENTWVYVTDKIDTGWVNETYLN
ncbi:MAG: hypothetical protein RLZZ38_763 [Bacteroidota bacterium]|jgi:hypothetical protein